MQSTKTYESLSAIPHDALAEKCGGKFCLTRLIAQRLKDIHNGAPLLVERRPGEAMLAMVCREIENDLVKLELHTPENTDYDQSGDFDYLGIQDDGGDE